MYHNACRITNPEFHYRLVTLQVNSNTSDSLEIIKAKLERGQSSPLAIRVYVYNYVCMCVCVRGEGGGGREEGGICS